jgi:hypothetical protein
LKRLVTDSSDKGMTEGTFSLGEANQQVHNVFITVYRQKFIRN